MKLGVDEVREICDKSEDFCRKVLRILELNFPPWILAAYQTIRIVEKRYSIFSRRLAPHSLTEFIT